MAFLRCARALHWIAHQLLLVISCFYEGYVLVSPQATCDNAEKSYSLLLDLLGRSFDKEGEKSDQMSDRSTALGVFHCQFWPSGKLFSDSAECRQLELLKSLSAAHAESRPFSGSGKAQRTHELRRRPSVWASVLRLFQLRISTDRRLGRRVHA